MKGRIVTLLAVTGMCFLCGCRTDARMTRGPLRGAPLTAMESVDVARHSDMSLARVSEVDLVEHLIKCRAEYSQTLKQLSSYYQQHGYAEKHLWAQGELADVGRIRPYHYLYGSEIPRLDLTPRDSIAEADALYKQAEDVAREAGHGIPALFNQERMGEALALFKQLIEEFPTSDKIDDAAFQCGELLKEYYKHQEVVAVQWYERAWTWDPSTPHQARFQAAVLWDYRLHDRRKALELYRAAIAYEPSRSNRHFALARIKELTETGPVEGQRRVPIAQSRSEVIDTAGQREPELTEKPADPK